MEKTNGPEGVTGPDVTDRPSPLSDALMAASMAVGRGSAARLVADASKLVSSDRVVDIGCGPGTALRVASQRCEQATGVDPSPASVRLCRLLSRLRHRHNVSAVLGHAEALPLPERSATVVWSLSSFHHWTSPARGLDEAMRILEPGGRLMVAERLVKPGARGHARHGLTATQLDEVVGALVTAGFTDVAQVQPVAGRTTWSLVSGVRPAE
jgi:ubiquinone/menaquinone biosynthesis C-methylase UbiE